MRCDAGTMTTRALFGEIDDRRVSGDSVVPQDDGTRFPHDSSLEISAWAGSKQGTNRVSFFFLGHDQVAKGMCERVSEGSPHLL